MRKINFLILGIALTSRVYASSNNGLPFGGASIFDDEFDYLFNRNNNYFTFRRDNTVPSNSLLDAILFSPGVISRTNAPRLNPLDFARYFNDDVVVVRIPFNPTIAGQDSSSVESIFTGNLIRSAAASELVRVPESGSNALILRDDVNNGIRNNNPQYRHPISLHIDRAPSTGPVMEFLLRRDVERTREEGENNAILSFMSCLRRYDRTDIITRLRDLGFFERR